MKKALRSTLVSSGLMAAFLIVFLAAAGSLSSTGSANSAAPAPATDVVSTPMTPWGPGFTIFETLPYYFNTGGSTCSGGHPVQYYYDFEDGTNSGWLPVGTVHFIKRYAAAGSYEIRAKARCSVDTAFESAFSTALTVDVHYLWETNKSFHVLPEAIWAPATGGGTWVTEVQITDITGGSEVFVCFNTSGGTWRGPMCIVEDTSANMSRKFTNILAELQAQDPPFNYYGKVGAIEFWTQDDAHIIRVASRTLNGNYSKTFPGLRRDWSNMSDPDTPSIIQNMTSTAAYRSSAGFFNAAGVEMTVDFQLLDSAGNLIGQTFSRAFAAYDYQSFNPFVQAGVPYPTSSYDNACLRVIPTSGYGLLFGFGALANNASNDPAAMITGPDQDGGGYTWNAPDWEKHLPEAIWAPATGGGTWTTEIQITDRHGGTQVEATFNSASGSRGPFVLWTGGNPFSSVKFTNILQTLQALDPSFNYYGKVGAIYFKTTQGQPYCFLVTATTKNGNYAKTYPATSSRYDMAVGPGYDLMVQNLTSNATYRSSVIFDYAAGIYGSPVTVECRLRDADGNTIGSPFSVTLGYLGFYSVNPFAAAGVPYPAYTHDNVWLHLTATSGAGGLVVYGATANSASNDPASHLPAMYNH
ncbi:MAG: hypothetical protein OEW05_01465 [Candidatus Aminicenantes bacterium]|nr:hypothetical protein [Candidatus Aminicenantes bacterium]